MAGGTQALEVSPSLRAVFHCVGMARGSPGIRQLEGRGPDPGDQGTPGESPDARRGERQSETEQKEGVTMSDKERKKKKLVRTLICVSAAVVVVLVIATLVIGQLPLPAQ